MTVKNQSGEIFRGTDTFLRFTAVPPRDITGQTAQLDLRAPLSSTVAMSKAATPFDVANGVWRVPLSEAETLALVLNRYLLSLSRTDPGAEDALATGQLLVSGTAKDP